MTVLNEADSIHLDGDATAVYVGSEQVWPQAAIPQDGLFLWFDATKIKGLVSGNPVSAWSDLSGNGQDASALAGVTLPTFLQNGMNGLSVLNFLTTPVPGTGLGLTLKTENFTNAAHVFLVHETITNISQYVLIAGSQANTDIWDRFSYTGWYGSIFRHPRVQGPGLFPYPSGTTFRAIYEIRSSTSGYVALLNSTQVYSSAGFFIVPINPVLIGNGLAAATGLPGKAFAGHIGEIIFYNRILPTGERDDVYNYLASKWGV